MRRILVVAASSAALFACGIAADAAAAPSGTGHPVGLCPANGGWRLVAVNPIYHSQILVDQVYGNNDGYVCAKDPGDPPGNNFITDNTVTGQGGGY